MFLYLDMMCISFILYVTTTTKTLHLLPASIAAGHFHPINVGKVDEMSPKGWTNPLLPPAPLIVTLGEFTPAP